MRIIIILLIVISFPIAWFISEFTTKSKLIRCILGIIAILCCFGLAWVVAELKVFKYNLKYGRFSKRLIEAVILTEENNDKQNTIKKLKELEKNLSPTYESQYNFDNQINEVLIEIEKEYKANKSVPANLDTADAESK